MKRTATFALLVALAFAACGGGSAGDEGSASGGRLPSIDDAQGQLPLGPAPPPPAEGTSNSPLPSIDVVDVASGGTVDLATLFPAQKPVLIWFWAPHCPSCAREAPGVRAFADEHADDLDVIGLGTQDDLDLARTFVARHELPFPMLWDPSFESWRALGVPGQPAAMLLAGDGTPLQTWVGPFDEREAVELARAA